MIRRVLALSLLFTTFTSVSYAAPAKPVKVVSAKVLISSGLSGSSGDELSGILHTNQGFVLVGTVESSTSNKFLTAAPLGLSDGFITAISYSGVRLFDLRLGTPGEDIASAVTRDATGNFWVVGASSQPRLSQDTNTSLPAINPDNALVDSTTVPTGLNRLLLWKISSAGNLLATYTYDSPTEIYPQNISASTNSFTITGLLPDTTSFAISVDSNGTFGTIASLTIKKVPITEITVIKAGTNTYKSFISKTTIVGIPSWKAKSPTPVIVQYNKANTLKAAYSFKGEILYQKWQSAIGLVVVTNLNGIYSLHVLPLVL